MYGCHSPEYLTTYYMPQLDKGKDGCFLGDTRCFSQIGEKKIGSENFFQFPAILPLDMMGEQFAR
jgi:hypothetical protein